MKGSESRRIGLWSISMKIASSLPISGQYSAQIQYSKCGTRERSRRGEGRLIWHREGHERTEN